MQHIAKQASIIPRLTELVISAITGWVIHWCQINLMKTRKEIINMLPIAFQYWIQVLSINEAVIPLGSCCWGVKDIIPD